MCSVWLCSSLQQPPVTATRTAHAGVKDGADEGGGEVEDIHGTQRESCEL